jgi:hypothetical protein
MFVAKCIEHGAGVCFVGTGIVTAPEISEAKLALFASEELVKRIVFAIVDFEAASQVIAETADIRRIIQIDLQLAALIPNVVVAVIAPKEHMYGLARMWEAMAECTGWKTGVFRSSSDACKWVTQNCALQ